MDNKDYTDQQLVKKALENVDFFSNIIERYEKMMLRYIYRISSFPIEQCEEILQDAFLKVWKSLNEYDPSLSFSSWLYRIVYTSTISYWRKEKKHLQNVLYSEISIEDYSNMKNLDDEIFRKFENEQIKQALQQLPIEWREILVLRYWETKSYEEISDIVKKPKSTVATHIKRAKEKLKKALLKLRSEQHGT